jgi:hypothetical protein
MKSDHAPGGARKGLAELGGWCAILLGVSYVVLGMNYLLLPAEQKLGGGTMGQFLDAVARGPGQLMAQFGVAALGGVLGLAAVAGITDAVRTANQAWMRWAASLAYVGFAVMLVSNVQELAVVPILAAQHATGDAAAKAAAATSMLTVAIDRQGWLRFGAVGLWVLAVSVLGLRHGRLPRLLAWCGVAVAVLYWLLVAGSVTENTALLMLGAGLGGILMAPIWFIGVGLNLLRRPVASGVRAARPRSIGT